MWDQVRFYNVANFVHSFSPSIITVLTKQPVVSPYNFYIKQLVVVLQLIIKAFSFPQPPAVETAVTLCERPFNLFQS